MKRIRLALVLPTILVGLCVAMGAASPSANADSREKIDELFAITQQNELVDQMVTTMTQQLGGTFAQMLRGRVDNAEELGGLLIEEFEIELRGFAPKLIDTIANLYEKEFTEDEIDDMIAFFSSKTGRRVVAFQKEISPRFLELGVKWGQTVGQQAFRNAVERLREKGHDIPL